jgi:hypothetical protein
LFFSATNVSFAGGGGGDRLRLRKAWDVPPSSIVRSKVRVAWTLAATLEVRRGEGGGGDREKVTWSISSNSMRTQGLGTKRRYLG